MKKYIFVFFILSTLFMAISCNNKIDELPPVKSGYSTEYIMPEAEFLTEEDRAIIEEQEKEYVSNVK